MVEDLKIENGKKNSKQIAKDYIPEFLSSSELYW